MPDEEWNKVSREKKIEHFVGALRVCSKIPRHLVGVDGRSFDGTSTRFDNKINAINERRKQVQNIDLDRALDTSELKSWKESQNIKDLAVITSAIDDLIEEQKKLNSKIKSTVNFQNDLNQATESAEEAENANKEAGPYRLMASLILFGIIDVLDIVANVLEHFGDIADFHQAVGEVLKDEKIMSFFGKINEALKIDEVAKALAQFPVLAEFNQGVQDFMKSDYLSPVSSIGDDLIRSDPAEFLLNTSVMALTINNEVAVWKKSNNDEEQINKIDENNQRKLYEKMKNLSEAVETLITKEVKIKLIPHYLSALHDVIKDDSIDKKLKNELEGHRIDGGNGLDFIKNLAKETRPASEIIEDKDYFKKVEPILKIVMENNGESLHEKTIDGRSDLLKEYLAKMGRSDIKDVLYEYGKEGQQIYDNINKGLSFDDFKREVCNETLKDGKFEVIIKFAIKAKKQEMMKLASEIPGNSCHKPSASSLSPPIDIIFGKA